MNIRQTVRRASSLGLAAMFAVSVVTSSLLILTTQTASAELAPLPEPVSPGENCEWMGEASFSSTFDTFPTATMDHIENVSAKIVSAPVANEDCGMLWSGSSNYFQELVLSNECTADPNDTLTVTRIKDSVGTGSGNYAAALAPDGGQSVLHFDAEVGELAGTDSTTYDTCGTSTSGNITAGPFTMGHFLNNCLRESSAVVSGRYINPDSQASVGKCSFELVRTNEVRTMDVTWRFKKVDCDPTIDSDGGGTSDCQEYEDGTNPMDASDDVAVVSPEVQNIIDTATTTGNECLGKVTQSAAKEAAAKGMGVRQIIDGWELSSLSGVDENSTFQQKKNAIQEFCKSN